MKPGKRRRTAIETSDRNRRYSLDEAVKMVKDISFAKFDESVDIAVRLGVNPKHADQMVRGAVVLPHGTGKTNRVLVFAKGEKVAEAEAAGADFVKTSTGFSTGGATVHHVELMRRTVGPTLGVKASGGVRDAEGARKMIEAGATRIGASASVAIARGTTAKSGGY